MIAAKVKAAVRALKVASANKAAPKYGASMFVSGAGSGCVVGFPSITAARAWAEEHGDTADRCTITRGGKVVALHVRDTSGGGRRWFRGSVQS